MAISDSYDLLYLHPQKPKFREEYTILHFHLPTMTPQEMASLLNGRQYREEMTKEEEKQAKADGLVIIIGYSDDNTEIRGAINDEVGCYNGGTIHFGTDDILQNDCDESECPYFEKAKEEAKKVEANYDTDGYCWTYSTTIPHESFDIMEDKEKYCRGIVFHISSLQ